MTNLYEIISVTKDYIKNGKTINALSNISLNIGYGDFISITGESGSGKSTLLNMLGALDFPTSGKILFKGKDITALRDKEISDMRLSHFGFIFQDYNLIPDMTLLENVAFPLKIANIKNPARSERALQAIRSVGMENRVDHLPSEISGGEEQRIAIARAIVNDPEVILADEPSGNLDGNNRDKLLDLLKVLNNSGRTVIIATHDEVVSQATKRVIGLKDGKFFS